MSEKFGWPLMSDNVTRDDCDALIKFLNPGGAVPRMTNGPQVKEFEKEWGEWLGTKHNVMVNSGSSANELTFLMLKHLMPNGGEVILPPLGWVSDVAAVMNNGFNPVFCDIKKENLALDIEEVKKKTTPNTRAILLIHILGYNGLTQELLDHCKENNILLIEDCCESHGATFNGQKIGTFGDISNFSFYFAHHLSSIEGGMICTSKDLYYQLGRSFRSHGMLREMTDENTKEKMIALHPNLNPKFIFLEAAHNYRSTELNAVIARNGLKRLDSAIETRKNNLEVFLNTLDSKKYFTDFDREGNSNYALTLMLKDADMTKRDLVEKTLDDIGVEYRRGMSGGGSQLRQPYIKRYSDMQDAHKKFPVTEFVSDYGWYIGNYPELKPKRIVKLTAILNGL